MWLSCKLYNIVRDTCHLHNNLQSNKDVGELHKRKLQRKRPTLAYTKGSKNNKVTVEAHHQLVLQNDNFQH